MSREVIKTGGETDGQSNGGLCGRAEADGGKADEQGGDQYRTAGTGPAVRVRRMCAPGRLNRSDGGYQSIPPPGFLKISALISLTSVPGATTGISITTGLLYGIRQTASVQV